jgi:hypothetical protein
MDDADRDGPRRVSNEPLQRYWETDTSPHHHQEDGLVAQWDDRMATCLAHLRSALIALEEVTLLPGSSPGDTYIYDQASASVWVALVALDACSPAATNAHGPVA